MIYFRGTNCNLSTHDQRRKKCSKVLCFPTILSTDTETPPKDFTRNRALPFHMLIFFLINMNKGSYQDELDHYFMAIHQLDVSQRFVTKGSLSKALKKSIWLINQSVNGTALVGHY